jgi:soluble lytic murein transglycosylase-like protein
MSSSGTHKRTRGRMLGRWRAAFLLSASMLMASQGVVPVQAKELVVPTVEAPAVATPKKPKKHKKHHHKKKPKTIKGMIEREFGKHADEALRIAFCESRFDPSDVSSAGAVGVFQIRPVDHGWRVKKVKDGKDLFDPWTNIRVAHHIYEHQGWGPWVCARIVGVSSGRRSSHRRQTTSTVSTWSPNDDRRRPRAPRRPGDGTMSSWQ